MKFRQRHAPQSFGDLVFADQNIQHLIADYVHGIREHHLMLHGPAGSGKTQAAHIILRSQLGDLYGTPAAQVFNGEGLTVKDIASMENMYLWQVNSCGKAVFLVDEVDFADTAAKRALRAFIEDKAYVTLICTTNNLDKLDMSYAGFWVTRRDQAARFSVSFVATPSVNVTPSMTKGNWFAPFRRRHVLAAA